MQLKEGPINPSLLKVKVLGRIPGKNRDLGRRTADLINLSVNSTGILEEVLSGSRKILRSDARTRENLIMAMMNQG